MGSNFIEMFEYISIATATLIIAALYTAFHKKSALTLNDLFLPNIESMSAAREAAGVLIHPLFWIVSLGIASLFIVSLLLSTLENTLAFDWILFAFSLIIFFALFDPIALWFAEGRFREPLRFVVGSLSYGALSALAAFFINSVNGIWINNFFSAGLATIIVISLAPIFEEILKMIGVVVLSAHKLFKGPLDGILIGFAAGAGFALMENMFYIITKIPQYSIELLLFRALYNTIAHGSFTAIGGAVLGKIKMDFGRLNVLLISIPILIAILAHTAFNILAIVDIIAVDSVTVNYYIFSPALVIALLLIVLYLIYYSKKVRRNTKKVRRNTKKVRREYKKKLEGKISTFQG